ncbi:MAG TPA: VOC family protein [Ktedonobacterales bacterium]
MVTRFDHTVIAVRDLSAAIRAFAALGFAVSPGGKHTGRGTENAIIRFGLDYLELLAVTDEVEARAGGLNRAALADFLREHDGGLAGYALASQQIGADAERLRSFGMSVEGPFAMSRTRPDGTRLAWRLAVPEGVAWRRPWPFLIEWETPDATRLAVEQPGTQPNGATGVSGVTVLVRDLEAGINLYQKGLGLTLQDRGPLPNLVAERARFSVGPRNTTIDLLAPTGSGEISQALAATGEGLYSVVLATSDLEASREYLASAGVATTSIPARPDALLIAPQAALGARLEWCEQPAS